MAWAAEVMVKAPGPRLKMENYDEELSQGPWVEALCIGVDVYKHLPRVNSHKRRVKGAAGHSLRHTLLTLAFRVLSASVNMLLGALRD